MYKYLQMMEMKERIRSSRKTRTRIQRKGNGREYDTANKQYQAANFRILPGTHSPILFVKGTIVFSIFKLITKLLYI